MQGAEGDDEVGKVDSSMRRFAWCWLASHHKSMFKIKACSWKPI